MTKMTNEQVHWIGDADEQACIANIVARYPWELFLFKTNAWQRRPRGKPRRRTGETHEWVICYDMPLHLASVSDYRSVAEIVAPLRHASAGIVQFAGDPRLIGVCRDIRDRKNRVWFTHSTALARDAALTLGLSLSATRSLPPAPEPDFGATMWVADQELEAEKLGREIARARRRCRDLGLL